MVELYMNRQIHMLVTTTWWQHLGDKYSFKQIWLHETNAS